MTTTMEAMSLVSSLPTSRIATTRGMMTVTMAAPVRIAKTAQKSSTEQSDEGTVESEEGSDEEARADSEEGEEGDDRETESASEESAGAECEESENGESEEDEDEDGEPESKDKGQSDPQPGKHLKRRHAELSHLHMCRQRCRYQ
jgi:TATA-binding protein-associated factor Taf7